MGEWGRIRRDDYAVLLDAVSPRAKALNGCVE
jgi:hypothetical protein